MAVLALGVSYRRASVDLLERLAFSEDELQKGYRVLTDLPGVSEGVILSTCNRVEVYGEVSTYHAGFQDLKRFLADSRGLDPEEFAEPLYAHWEDEATLHLFGVAAGIDSMVTGEPQILDQVREAAKRAEAEGAAGGPLAELFRRAVRFGARARRETGIGASPAAFIEAGGELAGRALDGIRDRALLVVGAGKMSALAVRVLRERGMGPVTVLNRTPERAERIAAAHGATAGSLRELERAVRAADLVVSSTGASEVILSADVVSRATADRRDRPLFLLDLAVPRDVDPLAASLPGVAVADIESLRGAVARDGEDGEVRRVREMAAEEVRRLADRRRVARLAPLIQALQERGERVRAGEIERLASRLASLDPSEREAVEALTRGIVAKLLHDPVVRVKELSRGGDAHARALAELFGLDPGPTGAQ